MFLFSLLLLQIFHGDSQYGLLDKTQSFELV
jgi:hypothetical protein